MWMVRWHLRRADLGQDCGARDTHQSLLVVEGEDFGADVLDARVNHIESVFTRIDVSDDPIVHVNEGLFRILNTQEHTI